MKTSTIMIDLLLGFLVVVCAIVVGSLACTPKQVNNDANKETSDSIHTEIRRYKLDSLRLELAIIEADMRNDSIRNDIRQKVKQSKP